MSDIAKFLRDRLNEDAAAALEAEKGRTFLAAVLHPARPLREVRAKRRVLERHRRPRSPAEVPDNAFSGCCVGCGFLGDTGVPPRTPDVDDCPELRDLAAPFDQHPDYDPAWRVE